MFESHLAPADSETVQRDLSSSELWETSLERSRRRRELTARQRRAAPKTRTTAAALSAALLVSPILAMAPAHAGTRAGAPSSAPPMPLGLDSAIASRGDSGGPVAAVQRTVGVDDDGIFGPITERAVKDFQARVGLTRTGEVDLPTWKALLQAAVTAVPPQPAVPQRIVAAPKPRRVPKRNVATPKRRTRVSLPTRTSRSGGTRPVAAVTEPAPAPAAACAGPIVKPVEGPVTSGFGDRRRHAGIDLSAPTGTPVLAAACGTVTSAAGERGYGNMICIEHSATFSTCYAHLSEMAVQRGGYVEAGQVIAKVGMTGRSSGPHLHFETRVNGRAQDPTPYLNH